jgi:hypothetical protein
MTLEEFNALPEIGSIGYREEIRDGRVVRIPVVHRDGAMFQKDDDPLSIVDAEGRWWMIGWLDGVRCKRRLL